MDTGYKSFGDEEVEYNYSKIGDNIASGIQRGNSNYWVHPDMEMLCKMGQKKAWNQSIHAIRLLEFFDTPQATKLLARMAQGHPDCTPTKLAKEIALRQKIEERNRDK